MYLMLFDNKEHIVSSVVPRGFLEGAGGYSPCYRYVLSSLTQLTVAGCSYLRIPTVSRNETSVQFGKCIFICLLLEPHCQQLWFRRPKTGSAVRFPASPPHQSMWPWAGLLYGSVLSVSTREVTDMYNVFSRVNHGTSTVKGFFKLNCVKQTRLC